MFLRQLEIQVTLKYAVSWCLRAGLMSPQAQGNNGPVIRPLPFLEPVQGLPLCLAWSAPALWLPLSSAPAFGAPLSSSHLPNPSHCRGSALPLPHQLLHGPSHAWFLHTLLKWGLDSNVISAERSSRPAHCDGAAPPMPLHLPCCSSQFLSRLEMMASARSFTCLLSAGPVRACQVEPSWEQEPRSSF